MTVFPKMREYNTSNCNGSNNSRNNDDDSNSNSSSTSSSSHYRNGVTIKATNGSCNNGIGSCSGSTGANATKRNGYHPTLSKTTFTATQNLHTINQNRNNNNNNNTSTTKNTTSTTTTIPNPYAVSSTDRIAIIGAGVAGIATAAALRNANYTNFIIYDQQSNLGGLWLQNYPNVAVQTSPHQYEYPGYPYPDHIRNRTHPPTPTGLEVRDYLQNVCQQEQILNKFQFNTQISNITKDHTTGIWTIVTTPVTSTRTSGDNHPDEEEDHGEEKKEEMKKSSSIEQFAFVIICTGLFSNAPHILNIPGATEFVNEGGGRILHTSQWQHIDEFRNQNILIIGNGKSAADAAIAASKMAILSNTESKEALQPQSSQSSSSTTTLTTCGQHQKKIIHPPIQCIRKQNWYVPRLILKFKFLFHSRLVSKLLPRYYEETSYTSYLLHLLCRPIKYVLWRILELAFIVLLRLPYHVWPTFGTIDNENSLSVPLLVTDERHLSRIRDGSINLQITQVVQLYKTKHALLSNGSIVPVDMIVMGTGWKLNYSFLDAATVQSHLDIEHDGLWLYRNMLAPKLPGIAFIGSNTLTFMNIYTSYVQAYWLVHLMTGQRTSIVSGPEMEACVQREKIFKRKHYPNCPIRGASIEAYMQHYHDLLFKEQGIDPYIYNDTYRQQHAGGSRCSSCSWMWWWFMAPIYNFFWPVLPETVSSSFDVVRSNYHINAKKKE